MPKKKRVAFTTARGKQVSFLAKTTKKPKPAPRKKPHAQRMSAKWKPSVKVNNKSRTRKIKADTARLLEAGLAKAHPMAPIYIEGARLLKDILDR